jgi:hypothetical protein
MGHAVSGVLMRPCQQRSNVLTGEKLMPHQQIEPCFSTLLLHVVTDSDSQSRVSRSKKSQALCIYS